jgi:hypothetical protein
MRVFAVLVAFLISMAATIAQAAGAKLIHYGWDNPKIWQLPTVIPKFVKSPFDGLSVNPTAFNTVFTSKPFAASVIAEDIKTLAKIDRSKLANSYVVVLSAADADFDWSNDSHWKSAVGNIRLVAKLAKMGGFKGIVFDMEPYGKNPWTYATQAAHEKLKFPAMAGLVRTRGKSFMKAMQQEYPGLQLWGLYGLSVIKYDDENVLSGIPINTVLADSSYGLWPAFYNGWFDAVSGKTRITDGNEYAYFFSKRGEYTAAVSTIRNNYAKYISPEVRAKYKAYLKVGHSVYVDAVMNTTNTPRFIGYYFKNDTGRARLLHNNIVHALQTSESLVWVYSEQHKWWQSPPRAIIDNAVRKAKSDAARGVKPTLSNAEILSAEKAVKNVVIIGGTFKDEAGNGVKPESFGSAFNDKTCYSFGDVGQYGCGFPNGTDATITPVFKDRTVSPVSRSFTKLGKSDFSTDWVVR